MKTFIYLSKYNRNVFKGLVKSGNYTDLTLLRFEVKASIDNWYRLAD